MIKIQRQIDHMHNDVKIARNREKLTNSQMTNFIHPGKLPPPPKCRLGKKGIKLLLTEVPLKYNERNFMCSLH